MRVPQPLLLGILGMKLPSFPTSRASQLRESVFFCKAECFVFLFSGVDGKNFRDQEMPKAEISHEWLA